MWRGFGHGVRTCRARRGPYLPLRGRVAAQTDMPLRMHVDAASNDSIDGELVE